MGKIVAIGGGEIGRPKETGGFYPIETSAIDKEIIRLSGRKNPKLLFIPTASRDSAGYYEVIKKYFGRTLNCRCDVLWLLKEKPKNKEIRKKVFKSDIVYVGGGNTLNMLNTWKRYGMDSIMREAYLKGIVLSGLSAGAICWFKYGTCDSRPRMGRNNNGLIRAMGLGLADLTVSPHHIREPKRKAALIGIMKRTSGIGIALDDYAALEIIGKQYRIIKSKPYAKAHKVYFYKGKLHYEQLPSRGKLRPIKRLLTK